MNNRQPEKTHEQPTQEWDGAVRSAPGDTHPLGNELETAFAGGVMRDGLPQLNKHFGRYRIEKQLGRGGMGAVYLAEDTELRRRVALKVPFLGKGRDAEVASRFLREARAAATLDHPNICPVHEVGEIDGVQYLAMAYIDGRSLSAYITKGKSLPPKQVAAVVRKMALALQEAHEKGIIHRDLKPSNVMVNQRKEPIIMDFGLAQRPDDEETRLTQTGMILGTPAYMSPEQIRAGGGEMGPEVDIYSLGVMLYELLTGELPFTGPPHTVIGQILTDNPLTPRERRKDLDTHIDAICMKAMSKSGAQRYGSMQEFAAELRNYIQGGVPRDSSSSGIAPLSPPPLTAPPIAEPAPPPPAGETLMVKQLFDDISLNARISVSKPTVTKPKPRRRNDALLIAAALVGLSGVASVLGYVWLSSGGDDKPLAISHQEPIESSSKLTAAVVAETKSPKADESASSTASNQQSVIPAFTAEDVAKHAEQQQPVAESPTPPPPPSSPPPVTITTPASAPVAASVTPAATSIPASTAPSEPAKPVAEPAKPTTKPADEGPIKVDGKNTEWRNFATVTDIRGDTNTGDLSRDIVRTSALYTYDDLYVMIETAEKPAARAYWLNLDLNGDGKEDIQMTVIPGGAFWVSIFAEGAVQVEGTGATCVIDEVYEMKLPLDFLVDVLPVTAASFRSRNSAQQIGIIAFTADPPDHKFVDFSKPLVSNRRIRLSK
ncbi:MAG: protein kinase [Planctomycetaceae bacterium]|nr:protein kinase [Planctomycetales bacterium]MCB9921144.1 protein kinase [Planctomycetaceae bacterium]